MKQQKIIGTHNLVIGSLRQAMYHIGCNTYETWDSHLMKEDLRPMIHNWDTQALTFAFVHLHVNTFVSRKLHCRINYII